MTSPIIDQPTLDRARAALTDLRQEVAKAVVGQDSVVTGLVIALLCRGHVLLEGVPGVAKTLLVRALAAALEIETKRVQFTPDLMPGDITGSLVYDARTAQFSFSAGPSSPTFSSPTRSTEPRRRPRPPCSRPWRKDRSPSTVFHGRCRPVRRCRDAEPGRVRGHYPLPEAQLDRFLLKLAVPVPNRDDEIAVLQRHAEGFDPRNLAAAGVSRAAGPADLSAGRAAVLAVQAGGDVLGYVVDVCRATRSSPSLQLGVSPAVRPRCWRRAGRGHGCRGVIS